MIGTDLGELYADFFEPFDQILHVWHPLCLQLGEDQIFSNVDLECICLCECRGQHGCSKEDTHDCRHLILSDAFWQHSWIAQENQAYEQDLHHANDVGYELCPRWGWVRSRHHLHSGISTFMDQLGDLVVHPVCTSALAELDGAYILVSHWWSHDMLLEQRKRPLLKVAFTLLQNRDDNTSR